MKINKQDIIDFVIEHSDNYDLSLKTIEEVALALFCADVSRQMVAKTAHMKGPNACLEEHVNAEEALHDYFGDGAFDNLYDKLWSEGYLGED